MYLNWTSLSVSRSFFVTYLPFILDNLANIAVISGVWWSYRNLKYYIEDKKRGSKKEALVLVKFFDNEVRHKLEAYEISITKRVYEIENYLEEELEESSSEEEVGELRHELIIEAKLKEDIFKIFNYLNYLATHVSANIVNKELTFSLLGKVYCDFLEKNMDILVYFKDTESMEVYEDMISLFEDWQA